MDDRVNITVDVDGDGVADIEIPVKPSWLKRLGLIIIGFVTWVCSGGKSI
jgi:hypothetical protein